MSQSSVVKTVGGTTTKITTMTRTVTSSSQQKIQKQQQQTQQKVTTKPPHTTETQKKNNKTQSITEDVCVRCNRIVYKLEEVIAEHQVWHRGCFRCNECDKPLNRYSKVDSFQIHQGVVYCKFHFKQVFGHQEAPKGKPELIIRENQPAELPDEVVPSSEQHHLGLEEIQTDAVKTRFQMFEKISTTKESREELQHNIGIKRSATVLSKMKKFHAKGMDVGNIDHQDNDNDDDSIHSEDYDDGADVDFIRAKRMQRERPLRNDDMNEIKHKFEGGMEEGRVARHEERKQEIQNIRSRLFWGKQARTKEMYQDALADLEGNSIKQRNKGLSTARELDNIKAAAQKTQNIKHNFETSDIYRREEFDDDDRGQSLKTGQISNKVSERMQLLAKQQAHDQIIKSHAKVKIVEKPDMSNQFEFFENYDPEEHKGKSQLISSENDEDNNVADAIKLEGFHIEDLKIDGVVEKAKNNYIDSLKKGESIKKNGKIGKAINDRGGVVHQNQTTSEIANGKSQLEEEPRRNEVEAESEISSRKPGYMDNDLEHARLAARTRDLKDLFEKWNYENNVYDTVAYNDSIPEYDEIDDSQTETTKTIRAKFEKLPQSGRIQNSNQPNVNRFVD